MGHVLYHMHINFERKRCTILVFDSSSFKKGVKYLEHNFELCSLLYLTLFIKV